MPKLRLTEPFSSLRRMFRDEDEDDQDPNRKRKSGNWKIESMDFSFLTLDEILKSEPSLLGETLHIITLRKFREALGDEWGRYVEKVQLIAESVVRRHVGRKGTAGREGDDTFVLSFASLPREEGARLAADIATDFMKILIGDRFADAPIGVGEVSRDRIIRGDGTVDAEALERAIADARSMRLDETGTLVATQEEEADGFLRAPDQVGASAAKGDWKKDKRARRRDEPRWQPLRWPPMGLARPEALTIPPIDPEDMLPDDMEVAYRAVWSRRNGSVDTFRILPMRSGRLGIARVLTPNASPVAHANLDLALVYMALEQIERGIEARRPIHMIVPVRYTTTLAPVGILLDQVLRYFPDPARARHLMIELIDLPAGIDREALAATVGRLQGLSRDVLLRANGRVPLDTLVAARPGAIGWMLGGRAGAEAGTFIDSLAGLLKGTRLYLWGVPPGQPLAAARKAEAIFVNADAIAPRDPFLAMPVADPLAPPETLTA